MKPDILKGFHNHHIVPKYMGGSDAEENLVLLHPIDHAIIHLVRYRMFGNIRDKWASNWLLKIKDPSVYTEYSQEREKSIKEKRASDPEFDSRMRKVRSDATKNRKEGYQKEVWNNIRERMNKDQEYSLKIIEGKKKARKATQKAYNKKNEEKVRLVRQMRANGHKYDEISKETGFFISVISGIINGKAFVGVGEL